MASKQEEYRIVASVLRKPPFELVVLLLGAADEPDAGHAEAPVVQRRLRRGDDVGVVGEPEVVVGTEVEHLPAIGEHVRRLR